MKSTIPFIFLCFLVLPYAFADLMAGFYNSSCPRAEVIVRQVVQRSFNQDRSIPASLLRMHFHDCFVRGCDASILIDSKKDNKSEKEAPPNQTVRGYELIDVAKKALENACPSTVSCADIIALGTRDAVFLAGGPNYDVPTGRRDGFVSKSSEVHLPGPGSTVSQALQAFTSKGMTMKEMVALLGAHTIGFTHCNFIRNRLINNDPSMDPDLRAKLVSLCGNTTSKNQNVFLDQNTSFVFDNQFYNQVMMKRGVLFIDQQLGLDSSSREFVSLFAGNDASFQDSFVDAVIKMGRIDVLVGSQGEIRRNCRVFNS